MQLLIGKKCRLQPTGIQTQRHRTKSTEAPVHFSSSVLSQRIASGVFGSLYGYGCSDRQVGSFVQPSKWESFKHYNGSMNGWGSLATNHQRHFTASVAVACCAEGQSKSSPHNDSNHTREQSPGDNAGDNRRELQARPSLVDAIFGEPVTMRDSTASNPVSNSHGLAAPEHSSTDLSDALSDSFSYSSSDGEDQEAGKVLRGKPGRGRNAAKKKAKDAKDLGLQLIELRPAEVAKVVR